jgi:hypothetical protein
MLRGGDLGDRAPQPVLPTWHEHDHREVRIPRLVAAESLDDKKIRNDGRCQACSNRSTLLAMASASEGRFDALFGGPARKPEEWLNQHHMDLAASIQAVTEDVVLRLTRSNRCRDRRRQSLHGRRGGAQLRGERQGVARWQVQTHLDPAGGRRHRRARTRGCLRCFMGTELDAPAVGNLYLQKSRQNPTLKLDYKNKFELD